MPTVKQSLEPRSALFPASNYAAYRAAAGTNFPVEGLAYDTSTSETAYFPFHALNYGSGNITVRVYWYAASASSGGVVWGASLAAITPNTDSQDIETKSFATEVTQADTHLGTTGKRLHSVDITVNQLDSIAAGDWVVLRLARKVADGSDTMSGDAVVVGVDIEYSDT
jgi:hypothetical protein